MADDLLILASASPRRCELLRTLVPRFEVCPCELSEPNEKPAGVSPRGWAEALAHFKARAVAEHHPHRWVLGADTVVTCRQRLLGKPRDRQDARRMLTLQAGRPSDVITGLCLLRCTDGVERLFHAELTRVWMRADRAQLEAYLQSGDWRGKAGAYGIQNAHDQLIAHVEGSFSNVVGLPLDAVGRLLQRAQTLG